MVTGNVMGSRYLNDLCCDIDHLYSKCACSSEGCEKVSQKVAHLNVQEEDMSELVVDGYVYTNYFLFVFF